MSNFRQSLEHNKTIQRAKSPIKFALIAICIFLLIWIVSLSAFGLKIYGEVDNLKDDLYSVEMEAVSSDLSNISNSLNDPLALSIKWIPGIGSDVAKTQDVIADIQLFIQQVDHDRIRNIDFKDYQSLFSFLNEINVPLQTLSASLKELGNFNTAVFQETLGTYVQAVVSGAIICENLAPLTRQVDELYGTWLLIAMTNSELRTQGGLPGAWLEVTFDENGIDLGDISSIPKHNNGRLSPEFMEGNSFTAEEKEAFPTLTIPQADSVYEMLDFSRTAQATLEVWDYGEDFLHEDAVPHDAIRGVVAIDPILFTYIISSFDKPIIINEPSFGETITIYEDNATEFLLNSVYRRYDDPELSDAVFARIAKEAFSTLFSFQLNPAELLNGIAAGIEEGRLLIYSENSDIELDLKKLPVGGDVFLRLGDDTVGIFANDRTASKIDWYLEGSLEFNGANKVNLHLTNALSEEEAKAYPRYIVGYNGMARTRGDNILILFLVAPEGSWISNLSIDVLHSEPVYLDFQGHSIIRTTLYIYPEETANIAFDIANDNNLRVDKAISNLIHFKSELTTH